MKFYLDLHLFGANALKANQGEPAHTEYNKCFNSGYSLTLDDNKFTRLFLNFTDGFHAFKPYTGGIFYREHTFYFNEHTSVKDIEAIFGQAVDGFKDAMEISRTFIISGLEIEFSWYHDANGSALTYMLAQIDNGFYGSTQHIKKTNK